jgi:hypothetical protein
MSFEQWYAQNMHKGTREELKAGWDACRVEALKVLHQPIQNADLSWDACDSRHIAKVAAL